jgi:hypothetical protein
VRHGSDQRAVEAEVAALAEAAAALADTTTYTRRASLSAQGSTSKTHAAATAPLQSFRQARCEQSRPTQPGLH